MMAFPCRNPTAEATSAIMRAAWPSEYRPWVIDRIDHTVKK